MPLDYSFQDFCSAPELRTVLEEDLQKKTDSKTSLYKYYVCVHLSQYSLIFDGAPSVFLFNVIFRVGPIW